MFPFKTLEINVFGTSHAEQIGVEATGLPEGERIDLPLLQKFLDRRKSGHNPWSTPRKEADEIIVESGITNGVLCGKFRAVIKNENQNSRAYDKYKYTPRPSHADYVAVLKDGDKAELSGGGRFSGRMTAPLCIVGGIAKQILEKNGVKILAYVSEIGGVKGKSYADGVTMEEVENALNSPVGAITRGDEMTERVIQAKSSGDSVGGSIECIVFNPPKALGDALYEGTEGKLAASLFAIPAVKAVEFGLGTEFARKTGSEANDEFVSINGSIGTQTNNNGGINGGITNGMPITMRVTVKPTPSISAPQRTVDIRSGEETQIAIEGRHDACIVPRAVPVVEAVVALAILDEAESEKIYSVRK